ncbi:MAG: 3-oxoacyl-ACP reductase family protein [Bacteroidota bacterium]
MSRKAAFVTGASRGIGVAIAERLVSAGLAVAVGYHRNGDLAEALVRRLREQGGEAEAVQVDVAERDSVRRAFADARAALGSLDVLVNNAAIAQEKPFGDITDDDWLAMMATNLQGPFICAQEALPEMVERGWGRIVNMVSIGGQWGGVNQVHYATAKAGLIGLTRSLAKVYSGRGINTNAVSPGLVATDMTAGELQSEAGREKARQIPVGRIGTVAEIAEAVAFLVGPGGDYVTGQTLNVNGGMYFG